LCLDRLGRVKPVQLSGNVEEDTNTLRAAAGGSGADAYIDFSPPAAAGSSHPQACIGALKYGGYAVLMGGVVENISFNYASLMLRNITVRGNFMYPSTAPAQLVRLIESGQIDLNAVKLEKIEFEKLVEGVETAGKNGALTVLTV
jgi:threonine dehydrogenase-like Zn-dependent dehydrogenase